jgi:hypothetical protein
MIKRKGNKSKTLDIVSFDKNFRSEPNYNSNTQSLGHINHERYISKTRIPRHI